MFLLCATMENAFKLLFNNCYTFLMKMKTSLDLSLCVCVYIKNMGNLGGNAGIWKPGLEQICEAIEVLFYPAS